MISDNIEGTVNVIYSNIGREWVATFDDEDGELALAKGRTRVEALRNLADVMEEETVEEDDAE